MPDPAQSGSKRYYDGHTDGWNPRDTMAAPAPARPDTPAYSHPAAPVPEGTFIAAAPVDGMPVTASPGGRWQAHVERGLYAYGRARGGAPMPDVPEDETDAWDEPDPRTALRRLGHRV
jgi:hypothetical protein